METLGAVFIAILFFGGLLFLRGGIRDRNGVEAGIGILLLVVLAIIAVAMQ